MKLSERLQNIGPEGEDSKQAAGPRRDLAADAPPAQRDPLAEFKDRAREDLYGKLESKTLDSTLSERELRIAVVDELERLIADTGMPLSSAERERLASEISEDILGYGPIQKFLEDPDVTEVMVNSTDPIYIERAGRLEKTGARFGSESHLRQVIERIVSSVGRRVDESSPMVDARLPDGSRVNAIIPPLAVDGPALTVRKFATDPYTTENLIEFGTMSSGMAALLKMCVTGKLNILISGGTGSGKTTLLNVLSSFVPSTERIVTIEDAVELQLRQEHVVRLESRPPNVEGRGRIEIRDLLRNALRMRPDRIIVGEVRGSEALDMLQAMNTGHEGSMSTVHSNSPRDALSRVETMVLMAGLDIPITAIREYISSALSIIVHLGRLRDGSRRVTAVTEIVGMEGDIITMQDIFRFVHRGVDDEGKVLGSIQPTGIRPKFAEQLADHGYELPAEAFERPSGGARAA
jgi:pilus assembly protein CpaF